MDLRRRPASKLCILIFDSDETMLEKLLRQRAEAYDLVFADDYIIEQAVKAGLTQELDKIFLPIWAMSIRSIKSVL